MQAALLSSKKHDALSQEIIKSRAKRAKQLTNDGRLLQNRIIYLAKYRTYLGGDYTETQTWLDNLLSKTQPLVNVVEGKNIDSHKSWENAIESAYRYAYLKVKALLSANTGFGMRLRTLTVNDLWERDYLELHNPPVPEIPQYIVYNEHGLQLPVVNDYGTHDVGVLIRSNSTTVNNPLQSVRVAKAEIIMFAKWVGLNNGRRNRITPASAGNLKRNANSPKSLSNVSIMRSSA